MTINKIDYTVYKYIDNAYVDISHLIDYGFTSSEKIDGTLDLSTIKILSDNENYVDYYDIFRIVAGDNELNGFASDIQREDKKASEYGKFTFTITVIEPTKYLEKIILQKMRFSNKSNTLTQQLERLLINAEPLKANQNPRFHLTQNLINFLGQTQGEDFYFQTPVTLREALDTMLAVKNARCEVLQITNYNDVWINYYDLSELGNQIDINVTDILSRQQIKNIEYLATDIEAYTDNAFSGNREPIYYPSPKGYATFKTDEALLTSSNAKIDVNLPIDEIVEFVTPVEFTLHVQYFDGTSATTGQHTFNFDADIIKNVVDKEIYDILSTSSASEITLMLSNELLKNNTIFYTRGQTELGIDTTKFLFGSANNFKIAAMNAVLTAYEDEINATLNAKWPEASPDITKVHWDSITSINADYDTSVFRIKYIPRLTAHIKIDKPNYQKVKSTIISNQNDKLVDLYRFGNMLDSQIKLLGNGEVQISRVSHSVSDLWDLNDYTVDGYMIVSRTFAFFREYIKEQYVFSKDFKNLLPKLTINREKRMYNIPLEAFNRDILIDKKIKVSSEGSLQANNVLKQITATFDNNTQKPITNVLVKTKIGRDYVWQSTTAQPYSFSISSGANTPNSSYLPDAKNYEVGTVAVVYNDESLFYYYEVMQGAEDTISDLFELPVASFTVSNSAFFHFAFKDNYSAGSSSANKVIGGVKQIANPYVDSNGEYTEINIRLFNDDDATRSTNYAAVKEFPKTIEDYYTNAYINSNDDYKIIKDAFEQHSFTIRVGLIGDSNVFIGSGFAKKLGLITEGNHGFKLFASSTQTYNYLSNRALGTQVVNEWAITPTSQNYIVVEIPDGTISWGIEDANGELIVGVNGSIPFLYFNEM